MEDRQDRPSDQPAESSVANHCLQHKPGDFPPRQGMRNGPSDCPKSFLRQTAVPPSAVDNHSEDINLGSRDLALVNEESMPHKLSDHRVQNGCDDSAVGPDDTKVVYVDVLSRRKTVSPHNQNQGATTVRQEVDAVDIRGNARQVLTGILAIEKRPTETHRHLSGGAASEGFRQQLVSLQSPSRPPNGLRSHSCQRMPATRWAQRADERRQRHRQLPP